MSKRKPKGVPAALSPLEARRRMVKLIESAHEALSRKGGKATAADFVPDILTVTERLRLECGVCGTPLVRARGAGVGAVMPCTECVGVNLEQAVEVLEELRVADADAMLRLLEHRVLLREGGIPALARLSARPPSAGAVLVGRWEHPKGAPAGGWDLLGVVGLLNGLLGDGRRVLAARVEDVGGRLELLGWELVDIETGEADE